MGLTILDRSIDHLEWVERKFRKELQNSGGEELQNLIEQQEEKEKKKESLEQKLTDIRRKRSKLEDEISEISNLLEQLGETAELEEERKQLQSRIDDLDDRRESINTKLEDQISDRGFLSYAMPAFEETAERLDELREAGEIPSELSNEFVDELLVSGTCICGRDLTRGTSEYQAVSSYKSNVEADGLDKTAIELISHFGQISSNHQKFHDKTDELINEREQVEEQITELQGEVDDIEVEMGELTDDIEGLTDETDLIDWEEETFESPSDLQAARRKKEEKKGGLTEKIGGLKDRISQLEDDIKDLQEQIDEAEAEEREADLARKRMQTASAVRSDLNSTYKEFQQTVRSQADDRVSETFEDVISSDYEAHITDNFDLEIHDPNYDTPLSVNKSRGERQVASLSFIGSLVDLARERYEDEQDYKFFSGGIYPVVMDSPFGALDNQHRREVSRTIPRLASQVVVMVTDSQWEGPVQEEMSSRIGKQYYLKHDRHGGTNGTPVTTTHNEPVVAKGDD